jgi:hypothetical protein
MKMANSTATQPRARNKPVRVPCEEVNPTPEFTVDVVRDKLSATEEMRLRQSGCAQRLQHLLRRLEEVRLWYERDALPDEDNTSE